ncbi:MAG: hypothetical protein ACLPVO_07885 [Desulfomonilaceae bacterium]
MPEVLSRWLPTIYKLLGIASEGHQLDKNWLYLVDIALFLSVVLVPLSVVVIYRQKWRKRIRTISTKLHDITNDIRNHYVKLDKQIDIDSALADCGQCVVDRTRDILKCLTGRAPHVSIRIIENSKKEPQKPKDARCTTLCWDRAKKEARPDDGKVYYITKSTPLKEIGQDNNSYHAKNWLTLNLLWWKTEHQSFYPNWADYYRSVLVVPIRVKTIYLNEKDRGDGEYTVMGFIWCDWKARLPLPVFRKKLREAYINMLLCVADGLFYYLLRVKLQSRSLQ